MNVMSIKRDMRVEGLSMLMGIWRCYRVVKELIMRVVLRLLIQWRRLSNSPTDNHENLELELL
ncbi:hypothetical protein CsSME_00020410 [Camellia sinensis var. sinensis]